MKTGIELIAQERQEQIEKHNYTEEWDSGYENYELATLARLLINTPGQESPMYAFADYALPNLDKELLKKMSEKSYKNRLIIAGALIAAEIDRLQNSVEVAGTSCGHEFPRQAGK